MSKLRQLDAALISPARNPIPASLFAIKTWLSENQHRVAGLADVTPPDGYVAYLRHVTVLGQLDVRESAVAVPVAQIENLLANIGEPTMIIADWMSRDFILHDTTKLDVPGLDEPLSVYRIRISALLGLNH